MTPCQVHVVQDSKWPFNDVLHIAYFCSCCACHCLPQVYAAHFFLVLLQSVLHASQVPRQRHNQLETNCLRKDSHSLALIKTNPRALTKTKTNTLTNHCTKTTLELESKQVHRRLQNLMLGLTSLLRGEDNKGEQRKKLGVKKKAQM